MSTENKKLVIGLFGFGVVGTGIYEVLQQTSNLNATIKKICIKDPQKQRLAPTELFTTDKETLLNDDEINVIVEVIDDAQAAFSIVRQALKNGKSVVSANKKMIAENLPELLKIVKNSEQSFLYESAACASIPIIRNLEEYYDNDLLQSIQAIVNGSTNYILSKIQENDWSYEEALKEAQKLGFAESDPSLDVLGKDAVNKWSFLLTHAYGIVTPTSQLVYNGITNIDAADAKWAKEKGLSIKLVAQAVKQLDNKIVTYVLPQFVSKSHLLATVKDEFNGVIIEGAFADKQFFYGKGAGSYPTASSLLSDIAALRYGYKYEYKKLQIANKVELSDDFYLRVYLSTEDITNIPVEEFAHIESYFVSSDRSYLTGVLHSKVFREQTWWKAKGTSLIVQENSIISAEELAAIKIHNKSDSILEDSFVLN